MGTVSTRQSRLQTSLSMKFLVVLALIAMALAEPEADPALVYTTNTLPLTASALHTPLVYNTQALQKPLVYTAAGVHHPLVYNSALHTPLVNTPLVYHSYGKREAEAEPEAEADPALIYTNTLPAVQSTVHSTVHSPLVYTCGLQVRCPDSRGLQLRCPDSRGLQLRCPNSRGLQHPSGHSPPEQGLPQPQDRPRCVPHRQA